MPSANNGATRGLHGSSRPSSSSDVVSPSNIPKKQPQRRNRKKGSQQEPLEWETFDFADSPKWDPRFDTQETFRIGNNTGVDWQDMAESEAQEDVELQKRFEKQHAKWDDLDEELIDKATATLRPFMADGRWEKIQSIMRKRTGQTRFLFENPVNPSNAWACLRTLDSFGIQHVDVVLQSDKYKGKAALSQKRGMRTAMGSAKWLTVKNHMGTRQALESLKKENYHIFCTDVNPSSKDIRDVDWDLSGKKVCIVMGNEQEGISDIVKEMADESFYLPMAGMAESFNLSVATAITCAHLSAASGHEEGKGPLRHGDLSEKEYKTLLLRGALNTVKYETATALFRRNNIEFPKGLNL